MQKGVIMEKGAIIVQSLEKIVTGTAPKRTQLYAVTVLGSFYLTMITIAMSLFPPPGYSPLNNVISEMGGIAANPAGWWVFDLTEIALGILIIPHFLYIYRKIVPTSIWVARFALLAGIIGGAGFALVGSIPIDIQPYHDFSAGIAFSGFTISILIVMALFLWKLAHKEIWPSKKQFFALYGPLFVTFPFVLVMPNIAHIAMAWGVDLRWFSWPPWQWTFMFSIMYWLIVMALIVPDASH